MYFAYQITAFQSELSSGSRSRGRNRLRYKHTLNAGLKRCIDSDSWETLVQDRRTCRGLVKRCISAYEQELNWWWTGASSTRTDVQFQMTPKQQFAISMSTLQPQLSGPIAVISHLPTIQPDFLMYVPDVSCCAHLRSRNRFIIIKSDFTNVFLFRLFSRCLKFRVKARLLESEQLPVWWSRRKMLSDLCLWIESRIAYNVFNRDRKLGKIAKLPLIIGVFFQLG